MTVVQLYMLYHFVGYMTAVLAMICHVLHPVEEQRVICLGFRSVLQLDSRTGAGTHTCPQNDARLESTENTQD